MDEHSKKKEEEPTHPNPNPNPNPSINSNIVYFKITDHENLECHFKVKRSTKMNKVIDKFCQRNNLPISSTRFLYHGNRIPRSFTLEQLGIQNEDEIDVMTHVHGGAVTSTTTSTSTTTTTTTAHSCCYVTTSSKF